MESRNNHRIGRFVLTGRLGVGGFATVYRAEDPELGRPVAIKLLHPHLALDQAFVRRFRAEARAVARLQHPHIVTIYEVGTTEDGHTYLVMELLPGTPLSKLIGRGGPLPPERAIALVRQLGSALDYVHRQGLVHRDLKPANVMVMDGDAIKLMDFGIARSLDDLAHLTVTGQFIGSPPYMSPEQILGEHVGAATDIYALGILTYELFAQRPPFIGSHSVVLDQQRFAPPPPLRQLNPTVPAPVVAAIEHALAKNPAMRPATAGSFAAMLTESPAIERLAPVTVRPDVDSGSAPGAMPVPGHAASSTHEAPAARHPLLLPAIIGVPLIVLLFLVLTLAYLRVRSAPGGGPASLVPALSQPTVTSSSPPSTPTPEPNPKLAASKFKICNDPSDCKETDFVVGESVAACFTLTPGGNGQPLAAVTTSDRSDPPLSVNDASVVARSDAIPEKAGDGCYPMKVLAGPLPEGAYTAWLLQGSDVLARAGFHAAAPPAPTEAPTPAPAPTSRPQPAAPAPQPTQRPAQPAQPIQPAQPVRPVQQPTPVPAPVQPQPTAPPQQQQPVPRQQQPVPPQQQAVPPQ